VAGVIGSFPVHVRRASLGVLIALLALVSGQLVAFAVLGVRTTNTGNQAALTTLAPPTNVATTHDGDHTTNPQQVVLTWTASSSSFASGYLVQRAADQAGACGSFATIATVTSATTTTYADGAAGYNQQFCYRVLTSFNNWTAPSAPSNVALSMPPTTATDTTGNGKILNAVFRQSATLAWAVGGAGTILMGTTNNGVTTWATQTSGTTQDLLGVSFISGSQGFVVGRNGTIVMTTTTGTSWTAQSSGTTQDLYAVSAVDMNHAWAVGTGGAILFYDGTSWTAQASGTSNNLYGVFAVKTGGQSYAAWAVGAAGAIEQSCDGSTATWTAQSSGTTNDLLGTWFISAATGWAVGKSGKIVVTSNAACNNGIASATWSSQNSGTAQDLNSISASSNDLWATGNAATLISDASQDPTTSFSWTAASAPAGFTYDLNGIGGIDGCKFIAVGEAAGIIDLEGSANSCGNAAWTQDSLLALLGINTYGITAGDLGRLARGPDAPLYETRDGWPTSFPSGCSGKFILFQMTPTFLDSAPISSTLATLTYQAATSGSTMAARLLVSGDGGATYTAFALNTPTTSLQTQTVDVHSVINTTATLTNMRLCFQATGSSPYPMLFDLVHVDVD